MILLQNKQEMISHKLSVVSHLIMKHTVVFSVLFHSST